MQPDMYMVIICCACPLSSFHTAHSRQYGAFPPNARVCFGAGLGRRLKRSLSARSYTYANIAHARPMRAHAHVIRIYSGYARTRATNATRHGTG